MTRFLDGPAKGQTLMLRRAPVFLRAVQGPSGWDALDQLDDTPAANERIVVYRLIGEPTWMHVRMTKGGGIFRGGTYRVVDPQPPEDVLRQTAAWRAWAHEAMLALDAAAEIAEARS